MKKNKNKNPENDDGQDINYEALLNGFISDDKKNPDEAGVKDGLILNELLAGIETQDENKSSKKKKQKSKDDEDFDLDIVPDINLVDILSENNDETPPSSKKKGKFEIDLGGIDDSEDIDYASILSEIDGPEDISDTGEKSKSEEPVTEEPVKIELDISNESLYESLISETPVEQQNSESKESESGLSFSLDNLISDSDESKQPETKITKKSKSEPDITASYEVLIDGLSNIDVEKEHEAPELESEPVADDSYKIDESEYASISEDEDIMKAYNAASSGDEEEITLLDESAASIDDKGILTTEETSLGDEVEILKTYETEETIELEALKDEPLEHEEPVHTETPTQAFVIPGMGSDDEEDFLKLNLEEPVKKKEEDFGPLAGIADVKVNALNEVLMPGIDMDAKEQVEAVTRAEVFLAQGKKKEAADIYASVSKKKGATPFVLKRLKELA